MIEAASSMEVLTDLCGHTTVPFKYKPSPTRTSAPSTEKLTTCAYTTTHEPHTHKIHNTQHRRVRTQRPIFDCHPTIESLTNAPGSTAASTLPRQHCHVITTAHSPFNRVQRTRRALALTRQPGPTTYMSFSIVLLLLPLPLPVPPPLYPLTTSGPISDPASSTAVSCYSVTTEMMSNIFRNNAANTKKLQSTHCRES